MGPRWKEGAFLGCNRESNTYTIGTEQGTMATRSISRYPEQSRWNGEYLAGLTATPWSERTVNDPEVRFQEPAESSSTTPTTAPAAIRRFRLNVADLHKYGFAGTCQQCQHVMRYGKARPGIQHSETCRERIAEAMSQDEVGRRRLDEYEDRTNRAMVEQVERVHGEADQAVRADRGDAPAAAAPGAADQRLRELFDLPAVPAGDARTPAQVRVTSAPHH